MNSYLLIIKKYNYLLTPMQMRLYTLSLLASLLFLVPYRSKAQSTVDNYVTVQEVQVAGKRTIQDLTNLTRDEVARTITYLDGLGRTIQTVHHQASPAGRDLIQPIAYDAMGRTPRSYLPFVGSSNGSYQTDALPSPGQLGQQAKFYRATQDKVANDDQPYAETIVEASPLARVIEQGAPGAAWQPTTNPATPGATLRTLSRSNYASENVHNWSFDYINQKPVDNGTFGDAELWVSVKTNEQQYTTSIYTNSEGKTVLKRAQINATIYTLTYYVYDDFGNLRTVIQPEGVNQLVALPNWNTGLTTRFLENWCFQYRYDTRQRLIEKYIPGGGWTYLVYDELDRVLATQTQKQAQATGKAWTIIKYDELGRSVMTAFASLNVDRATLQAQVIAANLPVYETRNSGSIGYTLTQAYPTVTEAQVQTLFFYDDYDYNKLIGRPFVPENGVMSSQAFARLQGVITGQAERVITLGRSSAQWLVSKNFYDDQLRLIQTQSDHYPTGGSRLTYDLDDFLGRAKATLLTHTWNGESHTIRNRFTYDHSGRILQVYQQMEYGLAVRFHPEILVAENEYNALGQLVDKKLHSDLINSPGEFLQSVDYRYNIRGWLTHINNRDLLNGVSLDNTDPNEDDNTVEPDLFGMELKYNEGLHLGTAGSQAQYNGNVAEAMWRTRNPSRSEQTLRGYAYTYDGLNRLTGAAFRNYELGSGGYNWGTTLADFSVSNITYDANGNLLTMDRQGLTSSPGNAPSYGPLDQLTYNYGSGSNRSNRLQAVDDQINNSAATHDFEDNGSKQAQRPDEYGYDVTGNLLYDINKGLGGGDWDPFLNKPVYIEFDANVTQGYINYTYSATGTKLRKVVVTNTGTHTTDYVGGFVYEDNTLQFGPMPEGRVLFTPEDKVLAANRLYNWKYEYHIKDHVGNLRFAFRDEKDNDAQRTAGMEPVNAVKEEQEFKHIADTRQQDLLHAHTGKYVARLNAFSGKRQGPSITLLVAPGDTILTEVYARYNHNTSTSTALRKAALLSGVTSQSATPIPLEKLGPSSVKRRRLPFIGLSLALVPELLKRPKAGIPSAYLLCEVYTRDSQLVATRTVSVQPTEADEWQRLSTGLRIDSTGYVRVSLLNDSGTDAYFDDLLLRRVDQVEVQENHYDPWGLNLVGIETSSSQDSKYQFHSKERQEELGLNWTDYGARHYDAQLGRWLAADPLADIDTDLSPYRAFYNNPLTYTDPTGKIEEGGDWFYDQGAGNASDDGMGLTMWPWNDGSKPKPKPKQRSIMLRNVTVTGPNLGSITVVPVIPRIIVPGLQNLPTILPLLGAAAEIAPVAIAPVAVYGSWQGLLEFNEGDLQMALNGNLSGLADRGWTSSEVYTGDLTKDNTSYVKIYKALTKNQVEKTLTKGFLKEDYPRDPWTDRPDGKAYFAAPDSRRLAEMYNEIYNQGILEITIPESQYKMYFIDFLKPYPDGTGRYRELRIPYEFFPVLNQYPKVLVPY